VIVGIGLQHRGLVAMLVQAPVAAAADSGQEIVPEVPLTAQAVQRDSRIQAEEFHGVARPARAGKQGLWC